MKPTEYWRWKIPDERKPGRTIVTSWKMTEADALARYPTAVREAGTMEVRHLPETDAEIAAKMTGAFRNSGKT